MPIKCNICGEQQLTKLDNMMRAHVIIDWLESYKYDKNWVKKNLDLIGENKCSCHESSQYNCSTLIAKYQTYCPRHTINSLTPKQCKGSGRELYNKCDGKVITNDGYCCLHENKCAECEGRIAGFDKYCVRHYNGYCKVSGCHQQTPNSRQSNHYIFCSEHAKLYGNSFSNYQQAQEQQRIQQETERVERAEQNQLKSLVQQKTSLTNPPRSN